MQDLNDKLKQMNEWSKAVVFDSNAKVISKMNCEPSEPELQ